MYDVTDPDSFNKVKTWVKELRKMLGASVCIAIVGNKTDLLPPNEQNSLTMNALVSEAQEYSNGIGNAMHYNTSAKLNRGIDELFLNLTKRMLEYQQSQPKPNVPVSTSNRTLRIADEPEAEEQETQQRPNKCAC